MKAQIETITPEKAKDILKDRSAILLRNYVLENYLVRSGSSRRTLYLRTQRAIQAFCAREHMRALKPSSSDIYTV